MDKKNKYLIDYFSESEKYKPDKVDILLVGEAPPPSQKKYFYLPTKMNPDRDIKRYYSLPATIFFSFFRKIPSSCEEYEKLLNRLKSKNIFLIDILDEPLKISDKSYPNWINQKNYNRLISEIPKLKEKIKQRGISIPEEKIIFLLARNKYKKLLKKEFPTAQFYSWKEFRIK